MPDATFQTKVYETNGGDKTVVASGGVIDIESGGALQIAGVDKTAQLSNAIAGTSAAKKFVGGEVTLDGSNPTSVVTGLATILGAVAVIKKNTSPGDDPVTVTVDYENVTNPGRLDIHAWKNTGGTDPTLVASTDNTAVISWMAYGT